MSSAAVPTVCGLPSGLFADIVETFARHGIAPEHTGTQTAIGYAATELVALVNAYRSAPRSSGVAS